MTGRDKILAALSEEGSEQTPVLIPYEGIFYRDHWEELFTYPWWYQFEPDPEKQAMWRSEAVKLLDVDWYQVQPSLPVSQRTGLSAEISANGDVVRFVNHQTNVCISNEKPHIGGDTVMRPDPDVDIEDAEAVMALIPEGASFDAKSYLYEGRSDLASLLNHGIGSQAVPVRHVSSACGRCVRTIGFNNFMMFAALNPEKLGKVIEYYFEQHTLPQIMEAEALGAKVVFIAETFSEMLPHELYKKANLPVLRRMFEEIRSRGMKSMMYYCGNPKGKLEYILDAAPDALALEEGKKGFTNDMLEISGLVNGRCALVGNIDSYGILERGIEEELRNEIRRQLLVKKRNGGRFLLSIGSPVTPGTTVERVRLYTKLAREYGGRW